MELKLHNNTTIADIRESFHRKFPFLKLEFFAPGAEEDEPCHRNNMIVDGKKRLGDFSVLSKPGYLSINEFHSVAGLEKRFLDFFGLYVQVFRKSGDVWIQTTNTDEWTLDQQNRVGEEKSKTPPQELPEDDYHDQL